ncbi:hypothetical protein [Mesorhizobium sp.]|uniref:hypothetical protein n=1 Tax=Mesorhizobium sp. TaxID=1871066 RepID=UPI000FE57EA9|nr:hypothetical protein [Mesorhizobium sp.]RWD93784.1 MAG: hypothetical protein EOS40_35910 [Mesorhizobium sp.]
MAAKNRELDLPPNHLWPLSGFVFRRDYLGHDGPRRPNHAPVLYLDGIALPAASKWGAFNAVSFGLEFLAVESISLRKFESHGMSSIRMWDDAGKILLTCEGAVRLSLTSESMRVGSISGFLQTQPL